MILIAVNQYGQFLCKWQVSTQDEIDIIKASNPDDYFVFDDFYSNTDYWDFHNHRWVSIGEAPSSFHIFNYESKIWQDTRSIEEIKNHKWQEIKSQRELLEFGGIFFDGHNYDCDLISQQRISIAIYLGEDVQWKTKDNQLVNLTHQQLKSLYQAIAQHITYIHSHAENIRQKIENTTSIDDIHDICW